MVSRSKSICFILITMIIVSQFFITGSSDVIHADSESDGMWMWCADGWWYQLNDTSYVTGWKEINGLWYYFDASGIMVTGWNRIDGSWYYMSESGAAFTGWVEYEGKWYYFDEDCSMHLGWLEDGDDWYYMKPAGNMLTGWVKDGDYYYYCDRGNGTLQYNCYVNGIWVGEDGSAYTYGNDYYKIDTMIMADDIVDSYVTAYASTSYQISECCEYVIQFPYYQYRKLNTIMDTDYWASEFARDIFVNGQGCCVSEAAALAFLFTELNVGTAYVDHDTGHAWTELNGRYYDPLFAEAKGYEYLNMSPSDYYTNHPVGWSEI